jgi:HEAT repeat protein
VSIVKQNFDPDKVSRTCVHYRWRGARDNAHEKLYELLKDPVPEVRAAAVFALVPIS